jgi:hypothetical protein
MTESDILTLLANRHVRDVFVPRVHLGPSGSGQMDAWAMTKSFTQNCMFGYEIKCSRSDFVRDTKWRVYLEFCSRFFFVAPSGIINPDELPPETGLLVPSKNGTMLFIKKKAPDRHVIVPQEFWWHLVMGRCLITRASHTDCTAEWKQWLDEKDEKKHIGYNVSKKIRELVAQRIEAVESANRKLRHDAEEVEEAKRVLVARGLWDESHWNRSIDMRNRLDHRFADATDDMRVLHRKLGAALLVIDENKPKTDGKDMP